MPGGVSRMHSTAAATARNRTKQPFVHPTPDARPAFGRRVYEPYRRVRRLRQKAGRRSGRAGRFIALLFLGAALLAVLPA